MATIKPSIVDISQAGSGSVKLVTWGPFTETDTIVEVMLPEYPDKSAQVTGTFGGGTVSIKGSNDGTNYASLRDPSSTAIAISAADIKAVLENTRFVKPAVTGATGASLTVAMQCHFPNPLRT